MPLAEAEPPVETSKGILRLDARVAWAIVEGSLGDHPVLGVDAGFGIERPRLGGPAVLSMTAGAAVGLGEAYGDKTNASVRGVGGAELAWLVAFAGSAVEVVPAAQIGYFVAFAQDERRGIMARVALGARFPGGGLGFHVTFEPVAFLLLPSPTQTFAFGPAVELGVIKMGWAFPLGR